MENESEKRERVRLERKREKLLCEKSFKEFVKASWHVLEPGTPLVWNWHYDLLCDEMQLQIERVAAKEPREYHLGVNIPPRSLKSMIFTRLPAAWAWINYPWLRFIRSSYAEELAIEHAVETRSVIESTWYQRNWGNRFKLKADQNNKSHFRTNFNGAVITTSTGAKVSGRGANFVSHDDPISPEQAESETELKKHLRFHTRTIISRLNNDAVDMFMVIMQRLHMMDLTGYLMDNEPEKWKFICLPAEDCEWVNPPELRKHYVNGYLFPERFGKKFCDEKKQDPYVWAGQYMQRPTPEEGGIFKRKDAVYWQYPGMNLPPVTERIGLEVVECKLVDLPAVFDDTINSWDFAFKDKKTSDFVAGHAMASAGSMTYFIDERHGRMSFGKSCSAMLDLRKAHPQTSRIVIENKANGPAIISEYIDLVPGIKAIESTQGDNTFSKANIMSKAWEAHNIAVPHPLIAKWTKDFVNEYVAYTGAQAMHDDRVSSGAQGYVELRRSQPVFPMYKAKTLDINIRWKDLDQQTGFYISEWVEDDLKTSIVLALWNARLGRLAIFDEFYLSTPQVEFVKPAIEMKIKNASGGVVTTLQRFEWYGNGFMFGRSDSRLSAGTLRRNSLVEGMNTNYMREGVTLLENMGYNESGSILLTTNLILRNKIIVDNRAQETNRQIQAWYIEGNGPAAGFGMARAVINLASSLYAVGKMETLIKKLPEFSPEKARVLAEMQRYDQENRVEEFVLGQSAEPAASPVKDSERWML